MDSFLTQIGGRILWWIIFIGFFIVFGGLMSEISKRKK